MPVIYFWEANKIGDKIFVAYPNLFTFHWLSYTYVHYKFWPHNWRKYNTQQSQIYKKQFFFFEELSSNYKFVLYISNCTLRLITALACLLVSLCLRAYVRACVFTVRLNLTDISAMSLLLLYICYRNFLIKYSTGEAFMNLTRKKANVLKQIRWFFTIFATGQLRIKTTDNPITKLNCNMNFKALKLTKSFYL